MARPVYDSIQPTAKERLKQAFWKLLSETDYRHITVKKISTVAQVNTNTFYYHYTSIDNLALDALNDEKIYEIPSILCDNILSKKSFSLNEALKYVLIDERWKKLRLFVTSDSAILHQIFYNAMEQFWLSLIGITKEDIAEEDYLDFTFILHGVMSIINIQAEHNNLDFINSLPDRALGQGIIQTLENLLIKYQIQNKDI